MTAGFWRFMCFCAVLGAGFWLVCFCPALEVKEIKVNGAQKISQSDCVKKIEDEVNKKIALFNSKSILLFNLEQTKKELLAQFPQIQNIKIERQFPSKIFASVEERRGVAIFNAQNGKNYLLDSDGVIFEEAGQNSDLLQINSSSEPPANIGAQLVARDLLAAILEIRGDIQNSNGIFIKSAQIANAQRVNLQTNAGWYIYFNPLKDADEQLSKLKAVLNDESFKQKADNLEYIDIRFTRVYLKEKN